MSTKGRPRKLDESQVAVLVQIVEADPLSTISEVVAEFERRSSIKVHTGTVRSALKRAGIERVQPPARLEADASATTSKKRYGYTEAHRRQLPEQTYPSCTTDAEWALVEHIFSNEGRRGMPPRYSRRALVDACCYVVRTG
jgi:hypothetical protein